MPHQTYTGPLLTIGHDRALGVTSVRIWCEGKDVPKSLALAPNRSCRWACNVGFYACRGASSSAASRLRCHHKGRFPLARGRPSSLVAPETPIIEIAAEAIR